MPSYMYTIMWKLQAQWVAGQFRESECSTPLHSIGFEFVSFFFPLPLRLCLLISRATLLSVGQRHFLISAAVSSWVFPNQPNPSFIFRSPLQLFSNKSCQLIYCGQSSSNFFATVSASERRGEVEGFECGKHWQNIYEPIIQTTFHCAVLPLHLKPLFDVTLTEQWVARLSLRLGQCF